MKTRAAPSATRASAPSTRPPRSLCGVGDAALAKATGRTWSEWIAVLDTAGARTQPHAEIARALHTQHGVKRWWAQMVTVGYEQAIGRRAVGQTCRGDFSANASRTFPFAAGAIHAWFTDARKRHRWLGRDLTLRSATAPKSARLGCPDGSIAGAWLTPKGAEKCSLGISHDGLPDAATAARHKAFWQAALDRLGAALAGPKPKAK